MESWSKSEKSIWKLIYSHSRSFLSLVARQYGSVSTGKSVRTSKNGVTNPRTLISLGQACDVAFQIRMHTGDNTSHFFDWLATPAEGLIHILKNDFDVFHPDHLCLREKGSQLFVEDIETGVRFFHQFPNRRGRAYESYLVHYPEFIEKFRFLAERFRETVQTKTVTFVRQGISASEAERLEEVFFERFPNVDVEFLYIVPPGAGFKASRGLVVEQELRKRGFGDIVQWASMLQSLNLIEKPFRISTVEILSKNASEYNFTYENRHSEESLYTACRNNPNNPWFQYELALNYIGQSMFKKAADTILNAIKLYGPNPEFQRVALKVDAKSGKVSTDHLANFLAKLFDEMPDNLNIGHDLLDALVETGQIVEGLRLANNLLATEPYNARVYFNKAKCLQLLGEHRLAELAIDRAIDVGPAVAQYYMLKESILNKRKNSDAGMLV